MGWLDDYLVVAQVRVDRLELRHLRAGLTATGDYALVVGADNLVAPKHQAVGYDGWPMARFRAQQTPVPPRA